MKYLDGESRLALEKGAEGRGDLGWGLRGVLKWQRREGLGLLDMSAVCGGALNGVLSAGVSLATGRCKARGAVAGVERWRGRNLPRDWKDKIEERTLHVNSVGLAVRETRCSH